ncbi:NirD/YgiW/YdeI family stress tolerance protein [Paraburkholderia lacunae]|uniref:Uncharacterized protein n=1 Tax=Paraburkholderia lacunae TaxID=2211104 RepID=A0A370NCU6_9BURK|nr:NirD/YgiW/YdeI family stress tolerance protein [Paraburkholderia lacunae]RDK03426.1 hypothetical protein DLM46_07825 [Paraburkholderia lacunae]
MNKTIIACLLAAPAIAAYAQYTGPGAEAAATTVKQLLDAGKDDQHVVLRGHLVKRVSDEQYRFADNTGQVLVKIDHKRWPAGQPVSDASTVELTGKYDKEFVGTSTVKVDEIKVIQ